MHKALSVAAAVIGAFLTGCATQQISPAEVAKLQGGTTTVVVYGFCVPADHLIKTTMYRYTLDVIVDGQKVGSMQSCGDTTFRVKSGYWKTEFKPSTLLGFPHQLPEQVYRPGVTQYLYMYPAGYGQYSPKWVSQAEAQSGIEEIRKIGQMF
ncbi:MAG: hypothetical protein AB7S74_01540 [Hyphomicrobium sp.]